MSGENSWQLRSAPGEGVRERLVPELMDDDDLDRDQTEQALADLDRVHRRLFGFWAVRRTLFPLMALAGQRQWLLDTVPHRVRDFQLRPGHANVRPRHPHLHFERLRPRFLRW